MEKTALVPYSAQDMYDLVCDIESYPRFLPWCTGAQVDAREEQCVTATIHLAKSGVQQSFTTRNTLETGRCIVMDLVRGPFKRLQGVWRFDPLQAEGCKVSFKLDFEFSNFAMRLALGKVFGQIADSLVDAFCQEARDRYGERGPHPG
jgi:ribosome-associated toxin RatA of RatAB toxin-antitoxin module